LRVLQFIIRKPEAKILDLASSPVHYLKTWGQDLGCSLETVAWCLGVELWTHDPGLKFTDDLRTIV